jgi:uncharacterized protein (TIGR02271 family)
MITQDISRLRDMELHTTGGDKLGKIHEIYEDTQSGRPEWALVKTGLLGIKSTFVPLHEANVEDDRVVVPYVKDQVKDAPSIDPDGSLSRDEERRLYRHYSLDWGESGERTTGSGEITTGTGGRFTREEPSGGGGDAMTRSEEELQVGTERRPAGGARLRKWVETEAETYAVPVQREEARIEREEITDENRDQALAGPEITDAEHEVTLMEEEPVVEKRVVPKERVRLTKDTTTDEEQVSGEVRKERIETDSDGR